MIVNVVSLNVWCTVEFFGKIDRRVISLKLLHAQHTHTHLHQWTYKNFYAVKASLLVCAHKVQSEQDVAKNHFAICICRLQHFEVNLFLNITRRHPQSFKSSYFIHVCVFHFNREYILYFSHFCLLFLCSLGFAVISRSGRAMCKVFHSGIENGKLPYYILGYSRILRMQFT